MGDRLANVSIDLDGLACYTRIHGLDVETDPRAIYDVALPRFLSLCDEVGAQATLFVITADLEHDGVAAALREAVARGHEVASHTHVHPYDLRRWADRRIADEIDRATDALTDAVGVRPVGFRTPGYNVDTRVLRILAERGYRYDSSVFPCPPYYLAKGAVMAAMRVAGKRSGSAMTHPAALKAPLQPYRPSRWDFSKRGDRKHSLPLWEFPIGVLPGVRAPVIGTTICALSPRGARALQRAFAWSGRILQIELHGVDFLDADDACIPAVLAARQPDLRRPAQAKREALRAFLEATAARHRLVTLARIAEQLDEEVGPTVLDRRVTSSSPAV